MHSKPPIVECAIPVLPVADLQRAIRFYTEQLGFKLDWESTSICSVSRDDRPIMLSQSADARGGVWVWIGLADDSLFHELRRRGVQVIQEAKNFSWAYEMKFADVDGNVLWLGTECRKDLPIVDLSPA